MSDGQQGWRPAAPGPPPIDPQFQSTPTRPLEPEAAHGEPVFDAVGMQSVLTRARDQSRFVAPPIEPKREPRRFPLRALLAVFVGIVVLGVVAGIVYVTFFREHEVDPGVLAKPTATASNQVKAQTPQEIVEAYFAALRAGDIERALAMGPRGGNGSERLLTPETYQVTMEQSPIGDVEILTREQDATRVKVRYHLGDRPIDAVIDLDRLDTGEYQLKRTTVPIQISVPGGDGVPLIVNGQKIDQGQVYEVVPGEYRLTTDLPYIAYSDASRITVVTLEAPELQKFAPVPQLTESGRAAFIASASRSLDECLAAKRKAPPNCPISMAKGAAVDESSITRTLTNDPWTTARPSLTASDQGEAEMTVTLRYTLSYQLTDGARQQAQAQQAVITARANLLGTTPNQVTVSWRS